MMNNHSAIAVVVVVVVDVMINCPSFLMQTTVNGLVIQIVAAVVKVAIGCLPFLQMNPK